MREWFGHASTPDEEADALRADTVELAERVNAAVRRSEQALDRAERIRSSYADSDARIRNRR